MYVANVWVKYGELNLRDEVITLLGSRFVVKSTTVIGIALAKPFDMVFATDSCLRMDGSTFGQSSGRKPLFRRAQKACVCIRSGGLIGTSSDT